MSAPYTLTLPFRLGFCSSAVSVALVSSSYGAYTAATSGFCFSALSTMGAVSVAVEVEYLPVKNFCVQLLSARYFFHTTSRRSSGAMPRTLT